MAASPLPSLENGFGPSREEIQRRREEVRRIVLSADEGGDDDPESGDDFPFPVVGLIFCPLDAELIRYYLLRKIMGEQLHTEVIRSIDLIQFDPSDLPFEDFRNLRENEAFCWGSRSAEGRNPNLESGYWNTVSDEEEAIMFQGEVVGYKKRLAFMNGLAPHGRLSGWYMDELRIDPRSIIIPPDATERMRSEMETLVIRKIKKETS